MTRDDIIRMAQEAGWDMDDTVDGFSVRLERFAALVIKPWVKQLEVERKKFQELNGIVTVAMQHARADEREACAKIAEYKLDSKGLTAPNSPKEWWNHACQNIRDAIRARGDKPTAVIYSPGQLAERGLTHEDVVKLIKENT